MLYGGQTISKLSFVYFVKKTFSCGDVNVCDGVGGEKE